MVIATVSLAQTMPGTEAVPLLLACIIVGWIAGIMGVVLSMIKACRGLALVMALLAGVSTLLIFLILFITHGLSPSRTMSSAGQNWLGTIVFAVPLILGIAAIAMLYVRGAIRTAR